MGKQGSTLYEVGTQTNYRISSQPPSSIDYFYSFDYIFGFIQ